MIDLVFITGNQHKADFLAKMLERPVKHKKLDLEEIQSLDLKEVVEHKVRRAYETIKQPVIVEDASLIFTAMGRLPGTFVKWFIEEIGYDGLLKLANSLQDQTAFGKVCYGYYDGQIMELFDGEMHGKIASTPGTGKMGFGFDPIFINDGFGVPRSDMTEIDYDRTSYRTPAISKLRDYLTSPK